MRKERIYQVETASPDFWSRRWADPSLQELGRKLVERHVTDEDASFAVENIWTFYSNNVLPIFRRRVPMGLGAQYGDDQSSSVWVYLPTLESSDAALGALSEKTQSLRKVFGREVATQSSTEALSLHLDLLSPGAPDEFDQALRSVCGKRNQDVIGIFTDQLEAELRNVIPPEVFTSWVNKPNLSLGEKRPYDVLHSSDLDSQQPLRELILSVKYTMAS